jgi:hypothetical protein
MPPEDDPRIDMARRALEQLSARYLDHPDVSLIDIGTIPGEQPGDEIVLRVHLRRAPSKAMLTLPAEIDGIPVHVIEADYRLE